MFDRLVFSAEYKWIFFRNKIALLLKKFSFAIFTHNNCTVHLLQYADGCVMSHPRVSLKSFSFILYTLGWEWELPIMTH